MCQLSYWWRPDWRMWCKCVAKMSFQTPALGRFSYPVPDSPVPDGSRPLEPSPHKDRLSIKKNLALCRPRAQAPCRQSRLKEKRGKAETRKPSYSPKLINHMKGVWDEARSQEILRKIPPHGNQRSREASLSSYIAVSKPIDFMSKISLTALPSLHFYYHLPDPS